MAYHVLRVAEDKNIADLSPYHKSDFNRSGGKLENVSSHENKGMD